jgi:uncharacterized membrane protein HdeD (DUF308 family)
MDDLDLDVPLAGILRRTWWVLLLRGLVAIGFGGLILFQPAISLAALVLLFGAYALADGILGVWTGIAGREKHQDWWVLLLVGLLGIGVGLMTFIAPGVTAVALLFYISIWAIGTGVLQIVAAVHLRKEIKGEWLLILCGLVSVAFGVLMMARPGVGAMSLLWMIATYAIALGVVLVMFAFEARAFGRLAHR